jgi:hypothetical protein
VDISVGAPLKSTPAPSTTTSDRKTVTAIIVLANCYKTCRNTTPEGMNLMVKKTDVILLVELHCLNNIVRPIIYTLRR